MLSILASRKRLNINNLPIEIINNLFHSFSIFLKVAKSIYMATKLKTNVLVDDHYIPLGKEKKITTDGLIDDLEIVGRFCSIAGMCLWLYSQNEKTAESIMKSDLVSFILKEISDFDLEQGALFSFLAAFHDICYNTKPISSLMAYHQTFIIDYLSMV